MKRLLGGVMSSLCRRTNASTTFNMCADGGGADVELHLTISGKTSIVDDGLYHQQWVDAASPTACTRKNT
jgi:hypothetical protein